MEKNSKKPFRNSSPALEFRKKSLSGAWDGDFGTKERDKGPGKRQRPACADWGKDWVQGGGMPLEQLMGEGVNEQVKGT